MRPWKTLETVATPEGSLQLRQRGEREFLIMIAGRVLMTSTERLSEEALATLACEPIAKRPSPRVLIGGLGMGYTLRAALDALPATAHVEVAELNPQVEAWCRGPIAVLTNSAATDPRVRIINGDVAAIIGNARPGTYDAIMLDLYEGPHAATQRKNDPFYGPRAIARSRAALVADGIFAVWSEEADTGFMKRLTSAGFETSLHRLGRSRAHVVYLGRVGRRG
jgi:spermidine synthase